MLTKESYTENTNVIISEEVITDAITTEVDAVANNEVITEEAVGEILKVNTVPSIGVVTLSVDNVFNQPLMIDYSQWQFRPTDYMEKLQIEVDAERLCALYPDKKKRIIKNLEDELKNFFGVVMQKDREVLMPDLFAEALMTVLTPKIVANQLFLYNNSHGLSDPISKDEFHAIAMQVIDDVAPGLWSTRTENSYTKAFFNKVRAKNSYRNFEYNMRYIAFRNGTMDIFTGKFTSHSKEYDATTFINCEYDPFATCPIFERTLKTIFNNDSELVTSLQDVFGAFLMHGDGDALNKFTIFYGAGANGKSLLVKTLEYVLGKENCSAKPLADLGGRFALSDIYDKMVNVSTEEKESIVNSSILKLLTSSDSVTVEAKYQKAIQVVPHVKLLTCCNELPKFQDKTDGMLRRILVFPFDSRFVDNPNPANPLEHKRDPHLEKHLRKERAGILNWMLDGTSRVYERGNTISMAQASRKFIAKIKTESDPVRVFVESCITKSTGTRIKTSEVHSHYLSWISQYNIDNMAFTNNQIFHREFKNQLQANGFPVRVSQINGYDYYYDFDIDLTFPLNPNINF